MTNETSSESISTATPAGRFAAGEDPARVAAQVKAYVQGMQGGDKGLAPGGVTTVVKHWVGYGAQIDGFDKLGVFGILHIKHSHG